MTTRDDGMSGNSGADGTATARLGDDFFAMVGHELRSPLNAMMGWTQYLRMAKPTPDQVEVGLEVIERNVRIQSQIIDDLLVISRLNSSRSRMAIGRVDEIAVVNNGLEAARLRAAEMNVEFKAAVPRASAWVAADLARLAQATTILFARAIELTPKGEAAHIEAKVVADSFELTVKDGALPSILQEDPLFQRPNIPPTLRLTLAFHILFQFGASIRIRNLDESWTACSPSRSLFGAARGTAVQVAIPLIK